MKYLINEDSKVTMKGSKVSAKTNETIYADQKDTYAAATMKEIAKANGFKITGKKQSELKASFDSELSKLQLAKVSTMKVSEEVLKIVKDGNKEGLSDDNILINVVNSGVKFGKAVGQVKMARIELGLAISDADRKKKSTVIMEDDDFEPETYDDVTKMVKQIVADVPNTNEQQALIQIRKFCKENKLTIPTKPKGSGVPAAIKLMAWMHLNITADKDTFEEYLEEGDRSEKVIEQWLKKFEQFKTEVEAQTPAKKTTSKKGKK